MIDDFEHHADGRALAERHDDALPDIGRRRVCAHVIERLRQGHVEPDPDEFHRRRRGKVAAVIRASSREF
jgi:hypothetical protein